MIQAVHMYKGTYVEAVFTKNYQPTVAQATEQPFCKALPHLPKLLIAAGWTISLKKSTNPSPGPTETLTTFVPCSLPMVVGGQS